MIYILSGNIQTGKSRALLALTKDRTNFYGILSPTNEFNERYFLNVSTGEAFKMEANSEDENIILVGCYKFLQSAFKKANIVIKNAVENNKKGYILIDELGKLEMRSEGLHESASIAIKEAMCHQDFHVILVVRASLLDNILEQYEISNPRFIKQEQLSLSFV